MFFQSPNTIFLGLTASCLILNACSTDSVTGGNSNQASVRYANTMAGGTGSLVFLENANSTGLTVPYQTVGACQNLSPASTDFSVEQSGTSTVLASLSGETLTAGSRYTVLATGTTTAPNLIFLTDTYTTPASGRGRLRVINAVGVGISFDVYIGTPGSALGTANQTNVGFNTSQAFLDIPAGLTVVQVTTPGTQTVLGTSGNFTVNSGDVTTLVVGPATTVGGAFTSFFVPECP
ncbi:MAG TPA: DUF4397 domain-containing protein [Gemmatimonadaceae bacterium]|jgi:hypothetical protein|nr:DUF4397 domain-containing protein [Gemmatimonadaceae bacterium]